MVVGRPGPLHGVAGGDRDRAGDEFGPALSDSDVRRRCAGHDRKNDDESREQAEVHGVGLREKFAADGNKNTLSLKADFGSVGRQGGNDRNMGRARVGRETAPPA